ncbi:MAG TPA: DUF58 domain-containing protein [Candidatus Limnocylindrales bacterium]|nr:DUF58 domain-containing protein [Candidatus Limnocylindrales bacterium]
MPTPLRAPERILQRLEWRVVRRLDGLLQGDYRTLFRGSGIDFADLREYVPGDDVRAIDWNVTARTAVPHVREYVEDREATAWFLLDLSPSIDFGSADGDRVKRSVLVDLVATLASVLARRGNRVGALIDAGRGVRLVPARSSRDQVLRLIGTLVDEPLRPATAMTDLGPLYQAALRSIRRRGVVFAISDFIAQPGWEAPLGLLARRHDVTAIRLVDRRELELPDVGPMILEDAETGEQLYVDSHDPTFRRRFAEAADQRTTALAAAFRRGGIDHATVSTDDDLVHALLRMAARRRHRRLAG